MLTTMEIIKKYNLITKKSFGQNFLTNPELLTKIVNCAGDITNQNVLEIGTGPAGLTTAILKQNPKKVVTVDMDDRCINIANNELKPIFSNLEIVYNDALKINENKLFNNEKYKIISNLPYNIGTVLLFKWLENSVQNIDSMTLLLQKEVVDRIVAKNGNKNYGRLSVMCQYLCDVKKCFDIEPTAFIPRPKVVSSVVLLTPKHNIDLSIVNDLSNICLLLFNQRRKTILNNLKKKFTDAENILDKVNISVSERIENIDINKIIDLVKFIKSYH